MSSGIGQAGAPEPVQHRSAEPKRCVLGIASFVMGVLALLSVLSCIGFLVQFTHGDAAKLLEASNDQAPEVAGHPEQSSLPARLGDSASWVVGSIFFFSPFIGLSLGAISLCRRNRKRKWAVFGTAFSFSYLFLASMGILIAGIMD